MADKARAIYGERYAEFLDNVRAYAPPFAVFKELQDFKEGEISLRFKPIAGRIDQAAGILFNLKPNGDYLIVRANALENNLVLFQYVRGKRSSLKWIRNTPTSTQKWHDLKLEVSGTSVKGYLDGKLYSSTHSPPRFQAKPVFGPKPIASSILTISKCGRRGKVEKNHGVCKGQEKPDLSTKSNSVTAFDYLE